ncbi:hypothetical protein S1OALGB6SA_1695 [Olavius algarvensis spirochete endosymbiont]|uniref:hypothetical protein n=1 Tax=Olavius algarvensis spirochete endosymbiont TaxID=260710 RepID=UPI00052C4CD6|nr:hypothetical protein [Olavius algarvensis spirochete endosymbiont]KGM38842.1 hypothetical protein JY97_14280 [Alkalispirochaeta odontotermitis]VDB00612.1 hypothetical protein S1OALGB6SA_1695 [Olavius algarvensis spirochete endosymbiont]
MRKIFVILLVLAVLVLSACAPGSGKFTDAEPANFLHGIWHGWIAPFTLIVSLFKRVIRIYETVNTGWWYDFGYYIAVIAGFGSLSLLRGRKRRSSDRDNH